MKKKLESVKKTNEYRSYSHKIISLAVGMKKALTKYDIKNQFRVEKSTSSFKRYANNLKLINKHFKGEQGLSMIQHQKSLLVECL